MADAGRAATKHPKGITAKQDTPCTELPRIALGIDSGENRSLVSYLYLQG